MAAPNEVVDAAELIEPLSKGSGALSRNEQRAMLRCSTAGQHVLADRAPDLVARADGCPMLTSKQADGTPLTVVLKTRHRLPSGQSVVRSGKSCEEFLLKNQFLRVALPGGRVETVVLVQEPVALVNGKKSGDIWEACRRDWKLLRDWGHRGCSVEHYAFDRCSYSAYERLWRQWHALQASHHDHLSPGLPVEVFRATEFLLFTPCALHDASNALKWAMISKFDNKDLLRDAYIGIESIRNSWTTITSHVCGWLVDRVSFEPSMSVGEIDHWRSVWSALDVDVETVEVLAEQLQLRFADGRLMVDIKVCEVGNWVSLIESSLLSTRKLTKWTESRWMSVGTSSRSMVAALLSGLAYLYDFIRDSGYKYLHYLRGFERVNDEVRAVLVECAIVSRVVEGALQLLMDDPRVCKQYDNLWQTISE